jgi:hypothetical protein
MFLEKNYAHISTEALRTPRMTVKCLQRAHSLFDENLGPWISPLQFSSRRFSFFQSTASIMHGHDTGIRNLGALTAKLARLHNQYLMRSTECTAAFKFQTQSLKIRRSWRDELLSPISDVAVGGVRT